MSELELANWHSHLNKRRLKEIRKYEEVGYVEIETEEKARIQPDFCLETSCWNVDESNLPRAHLLHPIVDFHGDNERETSKQVSYYTFLCLQYGWFTGKDLFDIE